MVAMQFYDPTTREKFTSEQYKIVQRNGKNFAVARGVCGSLAYRKLAEECAAW